MGGKRVHELILLDQADQALAEAQDIDQIKDIRDKAEAVRKYAQSASLGLDVQNRAAELKLRAERQAGKLLTQMTLRGGDRRSKIHCDRLKLDDLGISRNQSTRWQMEARVPEKVFREHVRETRLAGKELTSTRLIRLAKQWTEPPVVEGHLNGANGHAAMSDSLQAPGRPLHGSARSFVDPMAEAICELTNHHQLLDGILRPIYTGTSTTLLSAERRVLRYLLLESQQLLARLDKLQQSNSRCMCHDDRPAS